jgi:pentatricopeptide repeat protein
VHCGAPYSAAEKAVDAAAALQRVMMGSRWPNPIARAMRGAMGMGRGAVPSITVGNALHAIPDADRAALWFSASLFSTRGVAGSVVLGQGGGRGRGGGCKRSDEAPFGRTTRMLRSARGQKEVDCVLEAAQLNSPSLLRLIKDVGGMRGRDDEKKLDWVLAWTWKQTKLKPNVAQGNAFITQLGRRMRGDEAFDVYVRMKQAGMQPTVVTYNAMIDACAKSAQWERARAVFEEMTAAGMLPTIVTYNSLISAYGKGGQWERAKETFEKMQVARMRPNVITYSALISAYGSGRKWERAGAVLEEMKAASVKPNFITYNALINAYGSGGQWERAKTMFEEMQAAGSEPTVITYTHLINAFKKGGQLEQAKAMVEKMKAAGSGDAAHRHDVASARSSRRQAQSPAPHSQPVPAIADSISGRSVFEYHL